MLLPPQWGEDEWPRHSELAYLRQFFDFDRPFSEQQLRRLGAAYLGAVTYLDQQIGRVLGELDRLGLSDTTRVVYASDHGEHLGARGVFGKFTMYEESVAVPLIVAGPDLPAGKVETTPVSLLDLAPTFLEALGAPADAGGELPDESLFSLLSSPHPARTVFSEYHAVGSRSGYYLVADGRYKYTHYAQARPQLFDLEADPREERDLANDSGAGAILQRLRDALRGLLDPMAVDRQAKADQAARIAELGGRDAIVRRGTFDNSPVPGEVPNFKRG